MQDIREASRARAAATAVLAGQVLLIVAGIVSDRLLAAHGHPGEAGYPPAAWVLVAGVTSASIVGAAIVRDQPRHPVGWLFLALSSVILLEIPLEIWWEWGSVGSLSGQGIAATIDNSSWMWWFVIVALILGLTPTGTWLSPRWRLLGRAIVVAGTVAFVLALFREDLDAPYQDVDNPLALPGMAWLTGWVSFLLIAFAALGLVACGASLVLRWRRSEGIERSRLLWLVLVVIPLPVFVVGAFVASHYDADMLTLVATAGFIVLIPVTAWLSITRFHLYDVERVLARTTTYVLLSVILVGTYAGIVWLGAETAGRWATSPEVAATIGALVVAVIAAPLRRGLQDGIDRRFSRRRYEAVRLLRRETGADEPVRDLEDLLRRALGDPGLRVAYPGTTAGSWVSGSGEPVEAGADPVEVTRHGRVVARIDVDHDLVDAATVQAGAAVVTTELDNVRLRAALATRLIEVEESRRRLAEAQRTERRRIERDLHDGAQQRLLALAFDLQSAQLSGDPERMRSALVEGASTAQGAVRDLRSLANGLHPAALADGGLPAALDDLSRHATVPLDLDVEVERLEPGVEFTAWLVLGEAVVNAQKHARANRIAVRVRRRDAVLSLEVCDDGTGGANPAGPGLRGLRDRVEAAGGTVQVHSEVGQGTRIEAVIPCGS